jgi:hypothetical protein
MRHHEPAGWNATLERSLLTARDAAMVTRLLATHPPCCPLVRAAFARVLAQTIGAWSAGLGRFVRARAPARRKLEPALQPAHTDQPRIGEGR